MLGIEYHHGRPSRGSEPLSQRIGHDGVLHVDRRIVRDHGSADRALTGQSLEFRAAEVADGGTGIQRLHGVVSRPLGYHRTLAGLQGIARAVTGNLPYISGEYIVLRILYLEVIWGLVDLVVVIDFGDAQAVKIDRGVGVVVDLVELFADVIVSGAGVVDFLEHQCRGFSHGHRDLDCLTLGRYLHGRDRAGIIVRLAAIGSRRQDAHSIKTGDHGHEACGGVFGFRGHDLRGGEIREAHGI